jgi:hypothetical protein
MGAGKWGSRSIIPDRPIPGRRPRSKCSFDGSLAVPPRVNGISRHSCDGRGVAAGA